MGLIQCKPSLKDLDMLTQVQTCLTCSLSVLHRLFGRRCSNQHFMYFGNSHANLVLNVRDLLLLRQLLCA